MSFIEPNRFLLGIENGIGLN